MANKKLTKEEKHAELIKYRDLVQATLDYYIGIFQKPIQTQYGTYDGSLDYKKLKPKVEEHFQKGRLTMLKQWFRDITEMPIETKDLKFNQYLRDKTKYHVDLFESFNRHIDKIIEKGKITSDNQFYDVTIAINYMLQEESEDRGKIKILDRMLGEYGRSASPRKQ